MESHESIYELLGTYIKEREVQLGSYSSLLGRRKKTKFHELPGKNKQDFIRESTSHWVLMWQLEAAVRRELR